MSECLDPSPLRGIWARRGIWQDEEGLLVLRSTLLYRLLGLLAFLIGFGIAFYFSLLFALAKSLSAILVLGVFWAFGALLLWAGATMLADPWLISFHESPATVQIIERGLFPFHRKRRAFSLKEIERIGLRRGSRAGALGGSPFYCLELILISGERIEIDCGGAVMKEGLLLMAERLREVTGKPIVEEGNGARNP